MPGEWYCVEGQVELNTPGVPDGALRAWVDGTPVFDAAGIEFRRSDEPEISIESFWSNVYYGGKPPAPKDMKVTFDEVAVDGKRIGCGRDVPSAFGDVDGDGFVDEVRWEECSVSWCFTLTSTERNGARGIRELGNGAWFSLETARLGVVVADVDGDGMGMWCIGVGVPARRVVGGCIVLRTASWGGVRIGVMTPVSSPVPA